MPWAGVADLRDGTPPSPQTIGELIAGGFDTLEAARAGRQGWGEQLLGMLEAAAEGAASQPLAARVWVSELPRAGAAAIARRDEANRRLAELVRGTLAASPAHRDAPAALVDALVGGVQSVFRKRVRAGAEAELPELVAPLWSWATGYRAPAVELERVAPPHGMPPPIRIQPRDDSKRASDRIMAAALHEVASNGFHQSSAERIAARAAVPLPSLHEHFAGPEEAFVAALDIVQSRAYTTGVTAYRRAVDWPQGIRDLLADSHALLASNLDAARAALVEAPTAGPLAQRRHEDVLRSLEALLQPGLELQPDLPPVAVEAIAGAVVSLAAGQLRQSTDGPGLDAFAPLATYIVLAPFVGDDVACLLAAGSA